MAEDNEEQSPFTRRGFVAATVVVALIVVLGLVIVIVNMTRDDPDPAPTSSTSTEPTTAAPTSEPPEAVGGASVCGLPGEVLEGTLTTAPAAEWEYQGTTAYPTSSEFGPGDTSAGGVRFCFERSPEGALFAAANSLVQGSDPSIAEEWLQYIVAEGPFRDQLLADVGSGTTGEGTRLAIVGFRVLAYDGETARIDLAVRGTSQGQTITLSGVYELVWQEGDWKISADVAQPLNMATIPDTAGYIAWGE